MAKPESPPDAPTNGKARPGGAGKVVLRTPEVGFQFELELPDPEVTQEMRQRLLNRALWREVPSAADLIGRRCAELLSSLHFPEDRLQRLGESGVIEVSLPGDRPEVMAFPWEFVLAEATRPFRALGGGVNRPLLMLRRLDVAVPAPLRSPASILVVESDPGELKGHYDFSSERRGVLSSFGDMPGHEITDPTLERLRKAVQSEQPDVIHVTGIDSIQGSAILRRPPPNTHGMFLMGDGEPVFVSHHELAEAISAGAKPPVLAAFNMYYSLDMAASAVAAGAAAAIGFVDEIDDAAAELFFATLYSEWRKANWHLLAAYRQTWPRLISVAPQLRGTGIVLLTSSSLLDLPAVAAPDPAVTEPPREERRRGQRRATAPGAVPGGGAGGGAGTTASPEDSAPPVNVEYKPEKSLNYSLLHNDRSLFEKFVIKRQTAGVHHGVGVEIALHAGMETARYQATFTLDDATPLVDVAGVARLSLTSALSRSLDESVYTSLYVHVRVGDRTILQQTDRVELLPIDQWIDDDLNRRWLPSFVLPRDPAVRDIVDTAQRYLVALADDAGAGFDGYQSFDASTPNLSLDERAKGVDAQVQALWWALIHDFSLSYINPPPTFSKSSQRLRTPSDVIKGRRGTCIDLTLLLAACLEYVEIHPVIFLLTDHAFPGYCRSEASYIELGALVGGPSGGAPTGTAPSPIGAGMLRAESYAPLLKLVQTGHIVPLETVALTQRAGFWPSLEEGLQNLRSRATFETLYAIRAAREARITPLPIRSPHDAQ